MSDRIEKSAVLHAPLERVWHAISDSAQFGTWFGMAIDEPVRRGYDGDGRDVGDGSR